MIVLRFYSLNIFLNLNFIKIKKLILVCSIFFMTIFIGMSYVSMGQSIPPHPDDTICRCKGPMNICKGGNAIGTNSRCGTSGWNEDADRLIFCNEFQSNCGVE